MGCVRETPQIRKRSQPGMCKRKSPHKNKVSTGCVRETPQIKKRSQQGMCKRNCQHKNKVSMG